MNTDVRRSNMVHQGDNVRKFRRLLGFSQEKLAERLNISASVLSRHEQKEVLEDDLVEKIAKELNIPAEAIRTYNDETAMNFISNTFGDMSLAGVNNTNNTFNAIEKIVELYSAKEKLYNDKIELLERMLKMEQEKNSEMEKLLKNKK